MNREEATIEKKTARGLFWRFTEEVSTKAVSFVVSVILARLLVPENYSLISIAAIIISFADVVTDGGLSAALIQKGNADDEDYSTVFTFSVFFSILLYLLIFASAPAVGKLYADDEMVKIIRVLCLLIIINSVKTVFYSKLRTELRFKKIFISSFTGTVISAFAGICLAYKGYGAWALVVQQLTDAIIDTVIFILTSKVKVKLLFSRDRFRNLFSYSHNLLISSLTARIQNLITPAFISLRFSTLDLTYYSKAKGLSGYMLGFIETPLSQVLFPALSQIRDDREKLLGLLRKFYRVLYFFTLPALFGLFVISDDLVLLLFTEKWMSIVPYIRVFIIGMVFNKNIQGIKAIGRSDLSMKAVVGCRLINYVYLGVAMIVSKSPMGIAISYIFICATYFFVQVYLESRYLNYSFKDQLNDMIPSLLNALVMAAAVMFVSKTEFLMAQSLLVKLLIEISAGIVSYLCLSLIFNIKGVKAIIR